MWYHFAHCRAHNSHQLTVMLAVFTVSTNLLHPPPPTAWSRQSLGSPPRSCPAQGTPRMYTYSEEYACII